MNISSAEFKHNGIIPPRFTCQGEDVNPPLAVDGVPAEAKSLVLVVDDPDAPAGVWDHWIVFNIDPKLTEIAVDSVPGTLGQNSFGRRDWGGPCPPSGAHRYFFKLYALDTRLPLVPGASKEEVEEAMAGHIIDKAEIVGLYKKF